MPKPKTLNRGVTVVGAGMSKFGMYKDRDCKGLFCRSL
jgi:hypothetical protein